MIKCALQISKGAAHRGRTEGAVLPVRRSAPELNPYMMHSATNRWIRLGVNFAQGGNRSARRKPSKSGWDQLKLNPHATFVVEVEGVIDVHYTSLASRRVQHWVFYLEGANCNHFSTFLFFRFGWLMWVHTSNRSSKVYHRKTLHLKESLQVMNWIYV